MSLVYFGGHISEIWGFFVGGFLIFLSMLFNKKLLIANIEGQPIWVKVRRTEY